jgi:hypothetical protein
MTAGTPGTDITEAPRSVEVLLVLLLAGVGESLL